jgi:group I intron endonuclease
MNDPERRVVIVARGLNSNLVGARPMSEGYYSSYSTEEQAKIIKGIYVIINTVNGHFYLGSAKNLKKRWIGHRNNLIAGTHCNSHLQGAWDKYGEENFLFEVIENVEDHKLLIPWEQVYLDSWNPEYNIARVAGSPLGVKHSLETRMKVSAAMKGRTFSVEHRGKIGAAHKGRIRSAEHRANLGAAHRGKVASIESRVKMSEARKGRPKSDETRKRMSIARKGIVFSAEHRANMSVVRQGEKSWRAKLNLIDAHKVIREIWLGRPYKEIAERYGVDSSSISSIWIKRTWKNIPEFSSIEELEARIAELEQAALAGTQ